MMACVRASEAIRVHRSCVDDNMNYMRRQWQVNVSKKSINFHRNRKQIDAIAQYTRDRRAAVSFRRIFDAKVPVGNCASVVRNQISFSNRSMLGYRILCPMLTRILRGPYQMCLRNLQMSPQIADFIPRVCSPLTLGLKFRFCVAKKLFGTAFRFGRFSLR